MLKIIGGFDRMDKDSVSIKLLALNPKQWLETHGENILKPIQGSTTYAIELDTSGILYPLVSSTSIDMFYMPPNEHLPLNVFWKFSAILN